MNFKEKFPSFACVGDTIHTSVNGFDVTARIEFDGDSRVDDADCYDYASESAWQNGDWFYCGIVLSVSRKGVLIDEHAASVWGVEANFPGGNNSYLTDVANELLPEAIEHAKAMIPSIIEALTA